MGMSATQIGREFGHKTGAAMNVLLHEHGFLDGKPGAWGPSELGEQFAKWVDKDNGYGGFAARSWSWLTWDPKVIDALKESIVDNPNGVPRTPPAPVAAVTNAAQTGRAAVTSADMPALSRNQWAAVAALGVATFTAPAVGRAWKKKVQPAASRLRDRLARREPAAAPESGPGANAPGDSSANTERGPSPDGND